MPLRHFTRVPGSGTGTFRPRPSRGVLSPVAANGDAETAGTDLARRLEGAEGPDWDVLEEHTVGEVMSRALLALGPDAEAREAARLMLRSGVHRILVMEDDRLLGVVSTTDIVKAVSQHGIAG